MATSKTTVRARDRNDSSTGTSKSADSTLKVRNEHDVNVYCNGNPKWWYNYAYNFLTKKCERAMICRHCSLDGCKDEWYNKYENDFTPDNSLWTSLHTDNILPTSPSTCDDCQPRPPNNQRECFSEYKGNIWIPESQCKHLKWKRRNIEKMSNHGKIIVPPPMADQHLRCGYRQ
jgi:hypothetical protein